MFRQHEYAYHMYASVYGSQRRASNPPEGELQTVVSCMQMLGRKPHPSGGAAILSHLSNPLLPNSLWTVTLSDSRAHIPAYLNLKTFPKATTPSSKPTSLQLTLVSISKTTRHAFLSVA